MRFFKLSDVLLLALLIGGAVYAWLIFPLETRTVIAQVRWKVAPCTQPLTYRITDIDPRFHISSEEIHAAVTEAAEVWNQGSGRALLTEDPVYGTVTVRLVYDERQQITQTLASTTDPYEYNAIVLSHEQEFDQGEYTARAGNQNITIYEYGNHTALVRILAHEFGHTFGIAHVEDPQAIMYFRNEGDSLAITRADYDALTAACTSPFHALQPYDK